MQGDTETGTGSRTGLRSGGGVEAEANIKLWERLTTLIETAFTQLEVWVKATPYPHTQELAEIIGEDLLEEEQLWKRMEQVDLVSSHFQVYRKKITNIEKLITKMEDKVIAAPTALLPEDKNSYTA